MRGEHGLKPSRIIAERPAELLPDSGLLVIDGAGHMGPFTHASKVAALIARHIATIDAQLWKAQSRVAAAPMAGRVMIYTTRRRHLALPVHLRSSAPPTK
jgi:hypothetical protein